MIETAGLKCAPLMGPKRAINVASTATVAAVFANSATARLPPASRSAMIPEPITVAASRIEPRAFGEERPAQPLKRTLRQCAFADVAQPRLQRHTVERIDRQAE